MSPHLLRLTLLALLATLAAAHPKALECGSDSTTRLRVGEKIMMASVADAVAPFGATVAVSGAKVTVTANAGVFFAVRAVGAGATLSVGPGDLAETADCTSQVYYNGTGTSAGTWTLSHDKATSIVLGYASGPGVVSLVTAHIAPSPTPPPAPAAVDATGYLVDAFCWNKKAIPAKGGAPSFPAHSAPPAGCVDLAVDPQNHTMECLRDVSVCLAELYLLAQDPVSKRFFVKYTFDAAR